MDRALTIVKRRSQAASSLEFLQQVDAEESSGQGSSSLQLQRKFESIQLLNLTLTQENERLENMLRSQSAINNELQKVRYSPFLCEAIVSLMDVTQELEDMIRKQALDRGEILQTASDLETIAAKRQQKILQLEAQVTRNLPMECSPHLIISGSCESCCMAGKRNCIRMTSKKLCLRRIQTPPPMQTIHWWKIY